MNCPNCGAAHTGAGAFCIHCGARLTPQAPVQTPADPKPAPASVLYQATPIQPATVAPAPVSAPSQAVFLQRRDGTATIRHISAGSVFKVSFVTYLLLLGLLVMVVGGAIGPAIMLALSALIYYLVAGWVGGVRVRLQE